MKITQIAIALIPVLSLGLTGCNKTKQVFGLNKNPPNEFTVMERAPLEVPPEFNLLPPQPGVKRPQETSAKTAETKAKEAILASTKGKHKTPKTHAEKKLLEKAGAAKSDAEIRSKVDSEAFTDENREGDDKEWLRKKLPFYKEPVSKEVIDPKKEAVRLKSKETAAKSSE